MTSNPICAKRLMTGLSVSALRADLEILNTEEWTPVIPPRGDLAWQGIALRSRDGSPYTMEIGDQYIDTPLMPKMPYISYVLRILECDLRRVRLLALQPGASIGTHTDSGPDDLRDDVRLHLPIITNSQVFFDLSGRRLVMNPGELWYIDVSLPHSVSNKGPTPRIHLVVDCVLNEWLRNIIGL